MRISLFQQKNEGKRSFTVDDSSKSKPRENGLTKPIDRGNNCKFPFTHTESQLSSSEKWFNRLPTAANWISNEVIAVHSLHIISCFKCKLKIETGNIRSRIELCDKYIRVRVYALNVKAKHFRFSLKLNSLRNSFCFIQRPFGLRFQRLAWMRKQCAIEPKKMMRKKQSVWKLIESKHFKRTSVTRTVSRRLFMCSKRFTWCVFRSFVSFLFFRWLSALTRAITGRKRSIVARVCVQENDAFDCLSGRTQRSETFFNDANGYTPANRQINDSSTVRVCAFIVRQCEKSTGHSTVSNCTSLQFELMCKSKRTRSVDKQRRKQHAINWRRVKKAAKKRNRNSVNISSQQRAETTITIASFLDIIFILCEMRVNFGADFFSVQCL